MGPTEPPSEPRPSSVEGEASENSADRQIWKTNAESSGGIISTGAGTTSVGPSMSSGTVRPSVSDVKQPESATPPHAKDPQDEVPNAVGRYQVVERIDAGSFGTVYRAHDPRLERDVAIKLPHRHRIARAEDVRQFLREARILARLDHPHIVPVYDTGVLEDGRCFVVSKWIAGTNLARMIRAQRPGFWEVASLISKLASALQVAERERITHRDIKPANILVDAAGEPYLADFGLALHDSESGDIRRQGMTPCYASPEQARGEGHLVDGRSDMFSLGVVFYELLTGERPFAGKTTREVLEQIKYQAARPPRQLNHSIPAELERICLKTLEKRVGDRYLTAFDLSSDLRAAIASAVPEFQSSMRPPRRLNVFISYRREDTFEIVGRLCDRLQTRFGNDAVYLDAVSLRNGQDFPRQTRQVMEQCDIVLAVVGPGWDHRPGTPSRLADSHDIVRIELETALASARPIVAVLVGQARLPMAKDLPDSLAELETCPAYNLDAGPEFDARVKLLIEQLETLDQQSGGSRVNSGDSTLASSQRASSLRGSSSPDRQSGPMLPQVIPKGLRSFDRNDSEFFLQLLPGPTDRDGLPESIRFWKFRIESMQIEESFRVGLVYGPSGCGKSSLVKAGLLPRLSRHVTVVYLEASADQTESGLLSALRRQFPALPEELSLVDSLIALRRGQGLPEGQKLLIVLDQFEQWLHARRDESAWELVAALRQCDGAVLQCIVMVRDDFWMAVSRFLHELEVRSIDGENTAAVDLFDLQHAQRILGKFGQAFDRLDRNPAAWTTDQRAFLRQSVETMAVDGKVICVHLALFAEMMKSRPWTVTTLRDVGGARGLGVTFLEEMFAARTAPPEHRYHQKAARRLLVALLPESGMELKGHMRSREELLVASGYQARPRDFAGLMDLLDRELRLITPADPDASAGDEIRIRAAGEMDPQLSHISRFYQLTHDYLVPSLREWLTRKRRETRRGRAELMLDERSSTWKSKPEPRNLPSLFECLRIAWWTDRGSWSESSRRMMGQAAGFYGSRTLAACLVIGLLATTIYFNRARTHAQSLFARLVSADMQQVPAVVEAIEPHFRWVEPKLRNQLTAPSDHPDARRRALLARLALVSHDPEFVGTLEREYAETADPATMRVVLEMLEPYWGELIPGWWQTLHDEEREMTARFRAAVALAHVDAQSDAWTQQDHELLVHGTLNISVMQFPVVVELIARRADQFMDVLCEAFLDRSRTEPELIAAASAVARFAEHDAVRLARLLPRATPRQYNILFPLMKGKLDSKSLGVLRELAATQPRDHMELEERIRLGQTRANAAITALRLGSSGPVDAILQYHDDPEALTQFLHGLRARGLSPTQLLALLDQIHRPSDPLPTARSRNADQRLYGILLALGEFDLDQYPAERRESLKAAVLACHEHHPDAGVHGASGWLLRQWGFAQEVRRVGQTPVPFDSTYQRNWFVLVVDSPKSASPTRSSADARIEPRLAFTFVVLPAGDYLLGNNEHSHLVEQNATKVTLTRPVAVCDREVTWEMWEAFDEGELWRARRDLHGKDPLPDGAVHAVSWMDAVAYCRWLGQQTGIAEEDQWYTASEAMGNGADNKRRRRATWTVHQGGRGFRLLTDAEWESACRANTGSVCFFGSDRNHLVHYANCRGAGDGWWPPTGRFRPNPLGIFDMYGNLWEWCHNVYEDVARGGIDPIGPPMHLSKAGMNRGGAWGNPVICRSGFRIKRAIDYQGYEPGFRIGFSILADP